MNVNNNDGFEEDICIKFTVKHWLTKSNPFINNSNVN